MTRVERSDRYWCLVWENGTDPQMWVQTDDNFDSAVSATQRCCEANMARDGSGGDGAILDTSMRSIVAVFRDASPGPLPEGLLQEGTAEDIRQRFEEFFE